MTPEQEKLLQLWNDEEQRLTQKITALNDRLFVDLGSPLAWEKMSFEDKLELALKLSSRTAFDLVNAEAKLAKLKECRSEFKAACGIGQSGLDA